ncbi:MAG: DUF2461 domain-containing protein [Prevotellaceae bacterium]|jgi:uncharacterized protein (TIGR02453 family)|nr:DUF2461 domain-containing protein [Prevotellaceae bacterium]
MIQKATFQFLQDLAQHNDRDWFHAHRSDYEAARQNVLETGQRLLEEINKFDAIGFYDLRKSMFRIARDTRFAADKSPYKTNFGLLFNGEGTTRSNLSGYYMNIEPGYCFLSCGLYMPMPDVLKAVRMAIDDEFERFKKILDNKEFKRAFGDLCRDSDALTRIPKGFDTDSPAADYLKRKHFYVMAALPDKNLSADSFVEEAAGYYRLMKPLNDFLNDAIINH